MNAEPEAYTLREGVWVPTSPPRGDQTRAATWGEWEHRHAVQYTSDQSLETWAAGLDAVLGPPGDADAH